MMAGKRKRNSSSTPQLAISTAFGHPSKEQLYSAKLDVDLQELGSVLDLKNRTPPREQLRRRAKSKALKKVAPGKILSMPAENEDPDLYQWEAWKEKFGKVYQTEEEEAKRFAIFKMSKLYFDDLQKRVSHQVCLDQFSDMLDIEFEAMQGLDPITDSEYAQALENQPSLSELLQSIMKAT